MSGSAATLSPLRGALLIVAAALLWSTGGLAIKLVPLPALGVVFWRSFVSAIFLVVVFRPSRARWRHASLSTSLVYALMILTLRLRDEDDDGRERDLSPVHGAALRPRPRPVPPQGAVPARRRRRRRPSRSPACRSSSSAGSIRARSRGISWRSWSGFFFGLVILLLRRDAVGRRDPLGHRRESRSRRRSRFRSRAATSRSTRGASLLVLFLGIVQMGISYVLFVRGLRPSCRRRRRRSSACSSRCSTRSGRFSASARGPRRGLFSGARSCSAPSRAGRSSAGEREIPRRCLRRIEEDVMPRFVAFLRAVNVGGQAS